MGSFANMPRDHGPLGALTAAASAVANVFPPCCVIHGSTKMARHAYSPGCRPALEFLAPRLHLFSFILADDSDMLRHFLRHYHRLGVLPTHTRVAIRARRSATRASTDATLTVLREAGVPDANVRMIHSPPSDSLKIQLMNEHLKSLGTNDWSIYADVDELFDYPCELQGAVKRNKFCFAGTMWDQLAANGNITELTPEPDLAAQYPLQCRIRATVVPRVQMSKVILHRVYGDTRLGDALVRFRTTHSIIGNNSLSSRCAVRGLVRHYTMTQRQRVSNSQKARLRVGGASVTDARNYANATCGNIDPRTGDCLDYALLQRFMDNLASKASDAYGVSPLCPQTLQRMQKGAPCDEKRNPDMCR